MAAAGLVLVAAPAARAQQAPPPLDAEQVLAWIDGLSNWGRWGPEDELGTLNLITDAKRRSAADLVREGVAISLARDVAKDTTPDNPRPIEHSARFDGEDVGWGSDSYAFSYHGYSWSHLDALPHTGVGGRLYNGYPASAVGPNGADRLGIEVMQQGIFTRGVLIDLPRLLGVPYLEPGTAITTDVLERWERESGVRIEPGDVLLIRTGRWVKRAQDGPWRAGGSLAGLHASTAPWLAAHEPAVIGSDGVTDVLPSGIDGFSHPLHQIVLVALGTPLLDNLDLDALAEAAAERGRWTFLLTAAPVRFTGGLGSPINPIAVF